MPGVLLRRRFKGNAVCGDRLLERHAGGGVRLVARIKENLLVGAADQTHDLCEFRIILRQTLSDWLQEIDRSRRLPSVDEILPIEASVVGVFRVPSADSLCERSHLLVEEGVSKRFDQGLGLG